MKITLHISSRKTFNILENHIAKLQQYISDGKCVNYTSQHDFIESLYNITLYVSNTHTTLNSHSDYYHIPNTERHVTITSWARPIYTKTFTIDSSLFTYP